MKREMDKVRNIMLGLEALPGPYYLTMDPQLIGGIDDANEMVEYLQLLTSGGLLESPRRSTYRVSWAGHEFLDKVRDDEIWGKTKAGAKSLGSWSVKLLGELATGFIKAKAIELGLPIEGG